jgi:molecular chaperone GrpE
MTSKDQKNIKDAKTTDQKEKNGQKTASKEKKTDLESLQAKLDEKHDALLRAQAEVENTKKRGQKEVENAYKYSIEALLQEIIPIYDSLSLSNSLGGDKVTKEQLIEGNTMLLTMFKQIFDKNNIKEINPLNELFNPNFHQAISTIEDKKNKNDTISEVVQKGYLLNERVIKPALVIVVKNP